MTAAATVPRWSGFGLAVLLFVGVLQDAQAGNQREEAMADAVRAALARAITDSRPPQLSFAGDTDKASWQSWFDAMSRRLHSRMPDALLRTEFLQTVWYESRRAGLDPAMVMGLIQVESGFRKYAISKAGARGYMLKDVSLEQLVGAIRTVADGGSLVQPAVTQRLLSGLEHMRNEFVSLDRPDPLTDRETEILRLMASGFSNKEIANSLGVAEGTIKNHVSNILSKLGVRDRTRAVLKAFELQLV